MKQESIQERFLELLEPLDARLSRFCLAMTRDAESARDLMGDTVLAAWEGFGSLADERAFLSFLFTIARRIYYRRKRRERFFGSYDDAAARRISATTPLPSVSADIRMMYDALARLPASQREAVILFEISDLSLEEIRVIQGGTLSAVKSRVTRGRLRLAELLGVENDVEGRGGRSEAPGAGRLASEENDQLAYTSSGRLQ